MIHPNLRFRRHERTFVLPIAGGPPPESKDLLFRVEAPGFSPVNWSFSISGL